MRRSPSFLVVALLMLVAASSARVRAQNVPNDRFSVNHYLPAIGPGNYLQVDGAAVGGDLKPSVELWLDYARRPFVLYTAKCPDGNTAKCELDKSGKNIISDQLTTNIAGTLALANRVQLGLILPLVYTHGDAFAASTPAFSQPYIDLRGGHAFGLGDPRLSAKVRLVGEGNSGFMLAAIGYATAPVGHLISEEHSLGYDGFTAGGHFAAEYRASRFRIGANVGGSYRPTRELLSTKVGSDMYYGAAAAFDVTSLFSVLAELVGSTRFTTQLDENPLDWRLAARLTQGDLVFQLGGGAGLVSGVGIPSFRILGGIAYQPAGLDADGDGVSDANDACPSEREDMDGYLDEDGCPDDDNDGDGIPDKLDRCPNEAEDRDGFQDEDGCPDPDNDGDGILDGYDSCPDQAEDKDGDRDEDGCPDNDRDRDGVEDDKDKCPDEPEDTDGFGDEDGCPETDFDGDGIPDDQDQCPDQPEDKDGVDDDDGCPER
jgi:OmpA-OmpF porin, OOP family